MLDMLFAIRGVDTQNQDNANSGINRTLVSWALTALGGCPNIGTGYLVITGLAPPQLAGPPFVLFFRFCNLPLTLFVFAFLFPQLK